MKSRNIVIGTLLILLGSFWMLDNLGLINWSLWSVIGHLWPLILIVAGLNIVFSNVKYIKVITWGVFILIIITYGFYQQIQYGNQTFINKSADVILDDREEVKSGNLHLKLGGANIDIYSIDDRLLRAHVPNPKVNNQVRFSSGNEVVNIEFEQEQDVIKLGKPETFSYKFGLNKDVVWDIDGDMGAFNGTLDLKELDVSKLDLDVGAANLNVILGEKSNNSEVYIDGGATNIEITVPENVGVRVKINGALKDSNLDDLGWKRVNDYYTSQNYEESNKKINMEINLAVGKLNMKVK